MALSRKSPPRSDRPGRRTRRAPTVASSRKATREEDAPLVAVIMGSKSDWETMRHAAERLRDFGVAHESRVLSVHRTPAALARYASEAESRGLQVLIAGAGGAAHLPGITASQTLLPVLGVPVEATPLGGLDALLSIVQMPAGIPVGTLAIGKPGAINAAMLAIAILARHDEVLRSRLATFREEQADRVLEASLP